MSLKVMLIAAVAALLAGFGAGYWVADSITARKTVVVQDAALQAKAAQLEQRLKDETAATAKAQADLALQQGETTTLNQQLADVRTRNATLQEMIDHAPLDAPKPLPVAGQCPGNPLAGDEFSRLYESAATGLAPSGP